MKNKKNKREPIKVFNVGDEVYDSKYGFGTIEQVDVDNADFPYYGVFHDKKNGTTKAWWRADEAVPASEAPEEALKARKAS